MGDNLFFNKSLDILSHYGVAGMKWGEWNEETRRKYQGGEGRSNRDLKTDLEKANFRGSMKYKNRMSNDMEANTAFLMRRQGYDVSARSRKGSYDEEPETMIKELFPDYKVGESIKSKKSYSEDYDVDMYIMSPKKIDELCDKLASKEKDGASGYLVATYGDGYTKETFAYEVKDGRTQIYDSKRGSKINTNNVSLVDDVSGIKTIRTDNLKPNSKVINKYVADRQLIEKADKVIDTATHVTLASLITSATTGTAGVMLLATPAGLPLMATGLATLGIAAVAGNISMNSKGTKESPKAYRKAAQAYLKDHPNSTKSLAEVEEMFRKEWEDR